MKDRILIANSRLLGHQELQQILIHNQTIIAIAPDLPLNSHNSVIDMAGDIVSLGGIDLQINGALGLAFPDLTDNDRGKLTEIGRFLWQQGIDGYLPTIVTTSIEKIHQSLAVIAEYISKEALSIPTAQILGVHLEGPFLAYEKRGAHPAEYLLPLTLEKVKQVLGDYTNLVKIITLAPELNPSGEVISYLDSQKITVSLGHSLATAEQAQKAFKNGASMVTHSFNAMPGLHHRQPGLLGAAITNPKVYCGLIADGNHVCPEMIQILLKASSYDEGIFLVSDALAPLGLADGVYPWDSRTIEVTKGTARLADNTLAGTTLPLLVGVKNLVEWGICDVENAIAMATKSPRKAISLSSNLIGQPANLLRWHWDKTNNNLTYKRLSYI